MGCSSSVPQEGLTGDAADAAALKKHQLPSDCKYIPSAVLGDGASCQVFECKHVDTDQQYAMKIITSPPSSRDGTPSDPNKGIEMWENEVGLLKVLAGKAGRGIIQYEDSWSKKKKGYLIIEYCRGGQMLDHIHDSHDDGFNEAYARELARQLFTSIKQCHENQIVHRDLKCENLVFRGEDKKELVVIDFGCAVKCEDLDRTIESRVGSIYYVAPEVITNNVVRTGRTWMASDMWSCGIIMYLLACGFPPFTGDGDKECIRKICVGRYQFPGEKLLGYKIDPEFKDLIRNLLQKKPGARLSAAEALEHPWMKADTNVGMNAVVERVRHFQDHCVLKQAVGKALGKGLVQHEKAPLQEMFKRFDKDHNGRLDADELAAMLQELGHVNVDAKKMFESLDQDGDGEIDVNEMADGSLPEFNDAEIDQAFKIFDADGDGAVSVDELATLMGLSSEEAKELIASTDKDNDGKIGIDEWEKAIKNHAATHK